MNKGCFLATDEFLGTGDHLAATDGSCFLVIQRDGNLCLYEGSGPGNRGAFLWGSLPEGLPDSDFYAVMQGDGHLCVYRGTRPRPRVADPFVWGSGRSGHSGRYFLALEQGNVIVGRGEPASQGVLFWAARRRLRVMTYNTHLMAGSNLEAGALIANKKPVAFQDEQRHAFIVKKILDSGADLVGLQEVWSQARMARITKELRGTYPHVVSGATGRSLILIVATLIVTQIPYDAAGSGILLFSRYPIDDDGFYEFKFATDDDEKMASKGFVYATVHTPDGPVRVGMAHAWADAGGEACANIQDLTTSVTARSEMPGLMLGDFNVHRSGGKYRKMDEIMDRASARDTWRVVHPDDTAGSVTDDATRNKLAEFFSPVRDTESPDCLDYIYARRTDRLRPFNAEVLTDWALSTKGQTPKWYWVHKGTSIGVPSPTVFGPGAGKLCCVVRTADSRLLVALFDPGTRKWTHRHIETGGQRVTTTGAPSLVWFADTLHLFYTVNGEIWKLESRDGVAWSAPQKQGLKSSGGLSAVVHEGVLHLFVRDPTGGAIFYHTWGDRWSDLKWVGINTRHDISAAVLGRTICVVCRDNGSGRTAGVMRAVKVGLDSRWELGQAGHMVTTGSPCVTAHDGRFHSFYRESDGGGIFHHSSPDGKNWTDADFTWQATTDEVGAVSFGGSIVFFFPFVVNQNEKDNWAYKVANQDGAVLYEARALTHALWPADVQLDASDHHPYVVDFAWAPPR